MGKLNNPNLSRYVDLPEELGRNLYNNHWNTATPGGSYVCVHAFIGYDKNKIVRIAEILPLDICCWGVGSGSKGSYNFNPAYIQFEICEDDLKSKKYYDEAFNLASEYCAYLCKSFNIPTENIISHKEAHIRGYGSNHVDPEHWMNKFGETMNDFRNKVKNIILTDNSDASKDTVFKDGDLIELMDDATYYDGKPIPIWVKKQKWYIHGTPLGDRVVINKNESGTNSICSPVSAKHIRKAR